ncbi:MAG TPA: hypothetical protein PLU72_07025 [Candidatus Ozemobacteraceae bacterium]|nr:hypothetical protein [Candidatus Ozemobacteraceae bacterium]
MNIQAIQEYCKKNKAVAIGVPVIIGLLLFDNLILKPSRNKDKQQAAATSTALPAATADIKASPAEEPIKPPPPLVTPTIPAIDPRVEARLQAQVSFPYGPSRNVFGRPQKESGPVTIAPAVVLGRPDIDYHGFFTMGMLKVAIIKAAGRITLARLDSKIPDTPFILKEIHMDRVVLIDTENDNIPFDEYLTDPQSSSGKNVTTSISKLRASGSTP